MSTDASTAETQIFVSYSHRDAAYVADNSLLGFLRGLENDGARFWWDRSLQAGDVWDDEIKQISSGPTCPGAGQPVAARLPVHTGRGGPHALERVELEGLIIVPVIVSACDWRRYGWLSRRQHLPEGDKTLSQHYSRPGVREAMFLKIREALRGS